MKKRNIILGILFLSLCLFSTSKTIASPAHNTRQHVQQKNIKYGRNHQIPPKMKHQSNRINVYYETYPHYPVYKPYHRIPVGINPYYSHCRYPHQDGIIRVDASINIAI